MPSALSKQRDYKYIAEKYSVTNTPQVRCGKELLMKLNVMPGEKVLDMGCGTGEITAFIADQVGETGRVLGVDPDAERIKVATQKHAGSSRNINFVVGDSSSQLNEENYDIHFGDFVFQWLTKRGKEVFLQSAFRCLKPGGRLAILSNEETPENMEVSQLFSEDEIDKGKAPLKVIKRSDAELMVRKAGFEILSCDGVKISDTFPNLDDFITWVCVSDYIDESKILPHKKEAFAKKVVNNDGTVTLDGFIYRIIARKGDVHSLQKTRQLI